MADDVERLVLQMSADLRRFEREMGRSRQVADRRLREVEQRARQADKNLSRIMGDAGRNMTAALGRSLASIAPMLAAAFSAQQIVKFADEWTNARNALSSAGVATEDLTRRQNELVDSANRSRSSADSTVKLYSRLALATQTLGLSSGELIAITETINKSFQLSGATAQEAAGGVLQLSQALASGVLQGEELRSLRENAPELVRAIAKEMGVGVGALKELGAEGKITADIIIGALQNAEGLIDERFAKTTATISQALTVLNSELGRFIGQGDQSLSASAQLADAIIALSKNLDTVALVVGAVAALVGGRYVLALTAAASANLAAGVSSLRLAAFQTAMTASMTGTTRATLLATGATRAFSAALLANPIGAVILAVAALSAGLIYLSDKYSDAKIAQRELTAATDAATAAGDAYQAALEQAASKSGVAREAALKHAEALRILYRDAVNASRALAETRIQQAQVRLGQAQEAAQRDARTADQPRMGAGGFNVVQQGNALNAGRTQAAYRQAQADAAAAIRAQIEQEQRLAALTRGELPGRTAGPVSVSPTSAAGPRGGGKADTGPTPDELARMREQLTLQNALAIAQAKGDEAAVTTAQRRLDIMALTEQFERAQIANAEVLATAQVDGILNAEAFADLQQRAAEGQKKFADRLAESDERRRNIQLDQLAFAAELARLEGDPARIQQAERDLYIEDRITQLMREQVELTEAQARARAAGEWEAREGAYRTGEMREEFRSAFSEGIKAAIDGDLGGFFESMADRFTDRMLDNLADDLFDLLSGAAKGFGGEGGGGLLASIFGMFGKRALGGPVMAGRGYIVGERRPEVFVPNVSGNIIPNVNAAMARAQNVGGGRTVVEFRQTINLEGANGDETIRRIAYQASAQGASAAYQRAKSDVPTDMAKRQRYGFG